MPDGIDWLRMWLASELLDPNTLNFTTRPVSGELEMKDLRLFFPFGGGVNAFFYREVVAKHSFLSFPFYSPPICV